VCVRERESVCVCVGVSERVCYIDNDFDAICIADRPGYDGNVGVCV